MIARRNNISVIVIEGKTREYYNVMIDTKKLLDRVGAKVYEILVYAEGVWVNEKGELY